MNKQKRPNWADAWFDQVIEKSHFKVSNLEFKNSREWHNNWDAICHKSGLFFKIVGVNWIDDKGKLFSRPLIEQREIGTLGFLLHADPIIGATKILVQAKIEPGNVGACQIGPTYQATASNSARVHGGKAPAYKKFFDSDNSQMIFQTLQSEQGNRFLGKMNQNVVVKTHSQIIPTFLHKWVAVKDLLKSIDMNHFINTDSRSVLVCTPWNQLLGHEPFINNGSQLTQQLRKSYLTKDDKIITRTINRLKKMRANYKDPKIIGLSKLKDWKLSNDGINSPRSGPYTVRQIAVTAHGREVSKWDQPIIDSKTSGHVVLFCAVINGFLKFNFIAKPEAGLIHRVELSPSITIEPGISHKLIIPSGHRVIAKVSQSDEGGRFYQDICEYKIVMMPNKNLPKKLSDNWLTLGEICQLLKYEGIFTNESRSVLSLILKWA